MSKDNESKEPASQSIHSSTECSSLLVLDWLRLSSSLKYLSVDPSMTPIAIVTDIIGVVTIVE